MMKNVITVVKIMLISGATTAAPERSFSMARRTKTWLCSIMTQRNKILIDKLSLVKISSDFVNSLPNRRNSTDFVNSLPNRRISSDFVNSLPNRGNDLEFSQKRIRRNDNQAMMSC